MLQNGTEYKQNYLPQKSRHHAFTCVECLLTLEVIMSERVLLNALGSVRGGRVCTHLFYAFFVITSGECVRRGPSGGLSGLAELGDRVVTS